MGERVDIWKPAAELVCWAGLCPHNVGYRHCKWTALGSRWLSVHGLQNNNHQSLLFCAENPTLPSRAFSSPCDPAGTCSALVALCACPACCSGALGEASHMPVAGDAQQMLRALLARLPFDFGQGQLCRAHQKSQMHGGGGEKPARGF